MKIRYFILLFLTFSQLNLIYSQSGIHLFDQSYVHNIKIYFDQKNYWDTLTQRYMESIDKGPNPDSLLGKNNAVMSQMVIIDGNKIDSVGIKQKGYYSNWASNPSLKKPLKILFNEFIKGNKYDGLSEINLSNSFKDPSMLHEVLSYRIMQQFGIAAPRCSYANLYINDTLWGLYVVVEQINKTFLKEHFDDNSGNLYKVIKSDLKNLGNEIEPYKAEFEKKTNQKADDWNDLIELIHKINSTSTFLYSDTMPLYFDIDGFLKTMAIDVAINNWDAFYESGRNFYLYHLPSNNIFYWIPWDYNLAFSSKEFQVMIPSSRDRKPIIKRCLSNTILKEKYLSYLCYLNKNILTLEEQERFIDSMVSLITPSVKNDPNKFYPIEKFKASVYNGYTDTIESAPGIWEYLPVKGLKAFIQDKNDFLNIEISNEFFDCKKSQGN